MDAEKSRSQIAAEAIAALGDTPDQIAAMLNELGIKGSKGDGCNCPLANYAKRVTGAEEVAVIFGEVDCEADGTEGTGSPLSSAARLFYRYFDTTTSYDFLKEETP